MAQGLGHLDGHLFWVVAIPCYVLTAYSLRIVVRLVREEMWFRQLKRPRQDSNLRPAG